MTNTKIQINLNDQNLNIQSCFGHLIIDIWSRKLSGCLTLWADIK